MANDIGLSQYDPGLLNKTRKMLTLTLSVNEFNKSCRKTPLNKVNVF